MAYVDLVTLVFASIFLCYEAQSGWLDFDELSSINYGIDIINTPVIVGQEPPGAIVLRSKYGQQYQCSYADPFVEGERERQEQQDAIQTGISELLRPLSEGGCLIYPKDWWTYELCYGKYVKQYHVQEGKSNTDKILFLGHFESEFDWTNVTEKDKRRKYHSHTYTNGTLCDLTNKPRKVDVRFECQDVEYDMIYEISEAPTCVYTMVVHTSKLCKHPYLKRDTPSKAVPITCNPLVSSAQYEAYVNTIQESKVGDSNQDDLTSTNKATLKLKQDKEGKPLIKVHVLTAEELKELLKSKISKPKPKVDDVTNENDESEEISDIESATGQKADISSDGKSNNKHTDETLYDEDDLDESEGEVSKTSDSLTQQDHTEDDDEDEILIAEFNKELDEIVDTAEKKAHIEMRADNIESAMQSKFSDIVDEAEQETANEGPAVKVDRNQAFTEIAKTLTKLMSRLHRTEREKRAVEKHLMKAQILAAVKRVKTQAADLKDKLDNPNKDLYKQSKRKVHLNQDVQQDNLETDENDEDRMQNQMKDKPETAQRSKQNQAIKDQETLKPVTAASNRDETQLEDGKGATAIARDGNSLNQLNSLENRVRVRVTRIKHSPPPDNVELSADEKAAAVSGDRDQQILEIPDDQRQKLESSVKSELEKAGLETKGQKIEVKIITAGYFDTNKEGVHVLSEEESSAFHNMIVSILGGNSQAAKELSHQQNMENTYSYVWAKDEKKQQSATPQDTQPPVPPT